MAADGGYDRDVGHRMNEGYRAWGAVKSVLNNRELGIKAKKCLYQGVIVPTALYRAEAWSMRSAERWKVNVPEMKCLISLVGAPRMDKGKGKVFYGQEPPSGKSTLQNVGSIINYLQ